MKRVLPLLLLVASLTAYAQTGPDTLNIYTYTHQGHTYEVVKNLHSWTVAASVAKTKGGHLIHINSQGEQDSAYLAIAAAGIASNYVTVMDGGGIAYVWIGATDKVTEGTWLWDGADNGNGVNFWTGQGAAGSGGGSAQGAAFVNWGGKSTGTIKEPDDYASNQDAAAIALNGWPGGSGALGIAGEWNDISISNSLYYIIEYENAAIGELQSSETLKVWPNPASDFISVSLGSEEGGKLLLFNSIGQLSASLEVIGLHCELDLSSLRSGIYTLHHLSGSGLRSTRIVLAR